MRVIFLDFDGVLNCDRWYYHNHAFTDVNLNPPITRGIKNDDATIPALKAACFDPMLITNLQWIIKRCSRVGDPIMIVFTTSWKTAFTKSRLAMFIEPYIPEAHAYGVVTQRKFTSERGHDIGWWLDDHPEVTNFVIIDDKILANTLHGDHFFHTDSMDGLSMRMAARIADFLGINEKAKIPLFLF